MKARSNQSVLKRITMRLARRIPWNGLLVWHAGTISSQSLHFLAIGMPFMLPSAPFTSWYIPIGCQALRMRLGMIWVLGEREQSEVSQPLPCWCNQMPSSGLRCSHSVNQILKISSLSIWAHLMRWPTSSLRQCSYHICSSIRGYSSHCSGGSTLPITSTRFSGGSSMVIASSISLHLSSSCSNEPLYSLKEQNKTWNFSNIYASDILL